MVFSGVAGKLELTETPVPSRGPGQVLIQVRACGVCRTDLHVVDGELSEPKLPLIPGHQIVGTVVDADPDSRFALGTRIGVPWLGWTDGTCKYCRSGRENLCDNARFTGYQIDGGFADYTVADERFCFALPEGFSDLRVAPLLCAGLIGYRALRMCGDAHLLGLYGFGASAHIVCQFARYEGRRVFAFTRTGDAATQRFALELGAEWAGGSDQAPPEPLEAAIIFAPAGELVVQALRASAKAGVVVSSGIHMSDIPSFPYSILWEERVIRSVANLTRRDGEESIALAAKIPVHTTVEVFALERTQTALDRLRSGELQGAAVIGVSDKTSSAV